MLQASGISIGAENLDRRVTGSAESFQALVGLLTVIEGRGHAMDADKRVGHELKGGPRASLFGVVGLNMAID